MAAPDFMNGDAHAEAAVLISPDALAQRAAELGAEIDRDYNGLDPVLVAVLHGAMVFTADLMRSVRTHLQLGSVQVSSYPAGTERAGETQLVAGLPIDITGRHVLLVEDIVDTGHTIRMLLDHLQASGPRSLSVVTCLNKPSRRQVPVPLRYIGFEVPPMFVVGYGLDHSGHYRNLPYVGVLTASE